MISSLAAAADPSQLLPAREQMGFTLGFHIVLVPFGVAFTFITMIANWRALRRDDAEALVLAQRWSKVAAVLFAVGAVSGTVLSFEMGLLWPGLMGHIPLGIAAFGIVLRGSGFAFRKVSMRTAEQRLNGVAFAASSVITPFCFGAVAGAVASGRVPTSGHGDPLTSWLNPTSVLDGALAVLTCGYLAAIFLTAEAHRAGEPDLEQWSRRRALLAATAAGVAAIVGLFVLRSDAHRLYTHLLERGWPLIVISVLAGIAALLATVLPRFRDKPATVRPLGAIAVATLLAGWGVAQYPYLLGTHLTIHAA